MSVVEYYRNPRLQGINEALHELNRVAVESNLTMTGGRILNPEVSSLSPRPTVLLTPGPGVMVGRSLVATDAGLAYGLSNRTYVLIAEGSLLEFDDSTLDSITDAIMAYVGEFAPTR